MHNLQMWPRTTYHMPAARSLGIPGPIDVPHYFTAIWLKGLANVCTQETFGRTGDVQSVSSQALPVQQPLGRDAAHR